MKKITFPMLLCVALGFSSCSRSYLSPAISGNNMGYMARPMADDDKPAQTYITGSFIGSASPENAISFAMGMLNLHRGHTYKSFNFAYGIFGYLGEASHKIAEISDPDDRKNYIPSFNKNISGIGLKTSIGYQVLSSTGNTNFRVINWENSISREMGSYADFRKEKYGAGNYTNSYISNKIDVWTTGLSSEIIFHGSRNKNIQHSFRVFIGGTPGLTNSFDRTITTPSIAKSFNYYLKLNNFSFSYELSGNLNSSSKLSLGYSF
ncbi:hypothetical protein FBD94_06750 [Pedobacter hiemivivus]|jgi:hypothetical protein|uniref:Lipoprotein n=1 Tax=Pedobacter hiemivivus TaxID=2530454 RepID=A0A4U1GLX8_9SPHI|nr:hypothetical protein [Pedobacter hiemivivus]TKC64033.1 hypothetical protein FBD94_06750 [Pedobacter hiemivivus]